MPAKKKPFRKILPLPYSPVSFTVEDARRAAEAEATSRNRGSRGRGASPQSRSAAA